MKLITSEFYHKIFTEDCDDFEKVRQEILKEDNWLKDNYTENTFNQDYVHSREGGSQPCIATFPQCDGSNLQR